VRIVSIRLILNRGIERKYLLSIIGKYSYGISNIVYRLNDMITKYVHSIEVTQIDKLRNSQVLITFTIANLID
jgi:hypothetical protein